MYKEGSGLVQGNPKHRVGIRPVERSFSEWSITGFVISLGPTSSTSAIFHWLEGETKWGGSGKQK